MTDDLKQWEELAITAPDNRNLVLFSERIDGKLVRLERPFAGYLRPGDRFDYEVEGYRGHVIFPGGNVIEPDGTVRIYYGAADTVECLATARLDELLNLCRPVADR